MMPDKDGIETLQELKAQSSNPNLTTPTICSTANAISGAKEKYLAEGFDSENWKNYTVFVHGLKSTALSIDGEHLSDLAKNLETAGNILRNEKSSDTDKYEAHEFIKSHHAEAMKLYDELVEEGERYLK